MKQCIKINKIVDYECTFTVPTITYHAYKGDTEKQYQIAKDLVDELVCEVRHNRVLDGYYFHITPRKDDLCSVCQNTWEIAQTESQHDDTVMIDVCAHCGAEVVTPQEKKDE